MVPFSIRELLLGSRFPRFGSKHSSSDVHLSQSIPTALPATACLCFLWATNLQPHLRDVMETSITRHRRIDKEPLLLRLHPPPPGNLDKTQTGVGWHLYNLSQRCKLMKWFVPTCSLNKLQEIAEDRGAWHAAVCGAAKSRTPLSNWTTATTCSKNTQNFACREQKADSLRSIFI